MQKLLSDQPTGMAPLMPAFLIASLIVTADFLALAIERDAAVAG